MAARAGAEKETWLVVGHGSVGSFLAKRLVDGGAAVSVFDPRPRVAIVNGSALDDLDTAGHLFDFAVSCVPPDVVESVPPLIARALKSDGLLFDWNTVSPRVKRRVRDALATPTVDVALLDSLDAAVTAPMLAVSGREAVRAAGALRQYGFSVSLAGTEVGEAAALKYLRSIFMKGLEALVVEYESLASELDDDGIVRASITNNLGASFAEFMDILLATNRVHAERRSHELADAVATFSDMGARLELSAAAIGVLRQAAEGWSDPSAPAVGADLNLLAKHLRRALWRQPASM